MTDTETAVAMTNAPTSKARTHLEQLGVVLEGRGWLVSLTEVDSEARLKVTNPDMREMFEDVLCRRAGGGWMFFWPWAEPLGQVESIDAAVDRVCHVLRADGARHQR